MSKGGILLCKFLENPSPFHPLAHFLYVSVHFCDIMIALIKYKGGNNVGTKWHTHHLIPKSHFEEKKEEKIDRPPTIVSFMMISYYELTECATTESCHDFHLFNNSSSWERLVQYCTLELKFKLWGWNFFSQWWNLKFR